MKNILVAVVLIVLTPFAVLLSFVDWIMPGPHTLTIRGWFQLVAAEVRARRCAN